jgi:hypothetical protein
MNTERILRALPRPCQGDTKPSSRVRGIRWPSSSEVAQGFPSSFRAAEANITGRVHLTTESAEWAGNGRWPPGFVTSVRCRVAQSVVPRLFREVNTNDVAGNEWLLVSGGAGFGVLSRRHSFDGGWLVALRSADKSGGFFGRQPRCRHNSIQPSDTSRRYPQPDFWRSQRLGGVRLGAVVGTTRFVCVRQSRDVGGPMTCCVAARSLRHRWCRRSVPRPGAHPSASEDREPFQLCG